MKNSKENNNRNQKKKKQQISNSDGEEVILSFIIDQIDTQISLAIRGIYLIFMHYSSSTIHINLSL
jgi:hypothetical protein